MYTYETDQNGGDTGTVLAVSKIVPNYDSGTDKYIDIILKADFQSSHEAPRCECMHEHFHPITMLNS